MHGHEPGLREATRAEGGSTSTGTDINVGGPDPAGGGQASWDTFFSLVLKFRHPILVRILMLNISNLL